MIAAIHPHCAGWRDPSGRSVINGCSCGRPWSATAARTMLHRQATRAGVRRRFAPHQLRHAHALELLREGVPLNVDPNEIIDAVHSRRPPMISASVGLALPPTR